MHTYIHACIHIHTVDRVHYRAQRVLYVETNKKTSNNNNYFE